MSYYKGNVAKIFWQDGWAVESVYFLDTNCDNNIHTNFIHKEQTRSIIIPTDTIENFDPGTTKKVQRTFDPQSGTEHWKALV
jgi:hypothetical protein